MFNFDLTFSDAAKFADVARNLVNGQGFTSSFAFWGGPPVILPFTPFSIALLFKLFGINDFAVLLNSFIYSILIWIFTYLLSMKLTSSRITATMTALAVMFDLNMLTYAFNGSTESVFIFQIVAAFYFVSLRRKWATAFSVIIGICMYLTRPQAFIYLSGLVLFKLLSDYDFKKAVKIFVIISIAFVIIDFSVLSKIPQNPFVYSIIDRSAGVYQIAAGSMGSDILRTGISAENTGGIIVLFKKVFYSLYNFYKALPLIINPYLFAFFAFSLFAVPSSGLLGKFKYSALYCLLLTFLVAAVGIPAYRYIHPVIPFVYLLAISVLTGLVVKMKKYNSGNLFVLTLLILFFAVGQSLGNVLLDSRYKSKTLNLNKEHVYKLLALKMKTETQPNELIVTNLDTWGSWYGERKTIWYPNLPNQLIEKDNIIPFDAIYLTGYLIDDKNYYMGPEWRSIYENPADKSKWTCDGCGLIAEQFDVKNVYHIKAYENYERIETSAVLLVKKTY
jgi:hypothetical protein